MLGTEVLARDDPGADRRRKLVPVASVVWVVDLDAVDPVLHVGVHHGGVTTDIAGGKHHAGARPDADRAIASLRLHTGDAPVLHQQLGCRRRKPHVNTKPAGMSAKPEDISG